MSNWRFYNNNKKKIFFFVIAPDKIQFPRIQVWGIKDQEN